MKVERLARGHAATEKVRGDITRVLTSALEGRVCGPHCSNVCAQCGSISCHCNCSRDCPDAPRAMSTDPEKYPIEPGIAPLVYELKRIGIFRPCWSCEGHLGNDGTLWKLPQVWFYCDSMVHIRILADGLKSLRFEGKIRGVWEVHIEFSEPVNADTTFAIRPNLSSDGKRHTLHVLQKDVTMIAEALELIMRGEAMKLQNSIPAGA